jgi:hypothetical protein
MVGSRPVGRRAVVTASWLADRYLVDRLTAEQIGVLCGWSGTAAVPHHGQHRGVRTPQPVRARLLASGDAMRETPGSWHTAHLDSTVNTVLRTLHDHGIPLRRGGLPPRHVDRG